MNSSLFNHPLAGQIFKALADCGNNGDAFVSEERLFRLCKYRNKALNWEDFLAELTYLIQYGSVVREGKRLYAAMIHQYEENAAQDLAAILTRPALPSVHLEDYSLPHGIPLCGEQNRAVEQSFASRLFIIHGGGGSGKTTLISAIAHHAGAQHLVLCAPTGKAVYNLREKTGLPARTVHSALGVLSDEDFLTDVLWENIRWVIVDEASMMTLEMLAGLLSRLQPDAHLILLGDPNQLPSIGAGNVLPDLMQLGVPNITLRENHRQVLEGSALLNNVAHFQEISSESQLKLDDSFQFHELPPDQAVEDLADEAAAHYRRQESVQVLATTKRVVAALNQKIQAKVNPHQPLSREVVWKGTTFRDGDKVLITQNNHYKNCFNGDVGIFRILEQGEYTLTFCVELPDGRHPTWFDIDGLSDLLLAYAMTVHKAQGSEYDTVLFLLTDEATHMLNRSMSYTVFSRARKQLLLYGSRHALGLSIQTPARTRKSMLVRKTNMALYYLHQSGIPKAD